MENICIHLEATQPRQVGLTYCRTVKNAIGAEEAIKKCDCERYPEGKGSFKCVDYTHYLKAYEALNKVV
jgi:hypothetical protein